MLVLGHDIALHVMDGNDNKRVNSDNGGLRVFCFNVVKSRHNHVMESAPELMPTLTQLTM